VRIKKAVILLILAVFLVGCVRSVANNPNFTPDDRYDIYVVDHLTGFYDKACGEITNWNMFSGKTRLSYNYKPDQNPTTVTVMVDRIVLVDGYSVNFFSDSPTLVYKHKIEITGSERDRAISLAMEKVEGKPSLILTFRLAQTETGFEASDFRCSLP
jgi:hypothetical protein